ncbi:MAG TPA: hypothetical protein VMT03_21205 [Polyangia bacterium]|nr:hypothetical protein [Polyangia bacterium]
MRTGVLLWRKDGYAVVRHVTNDGWVKLLWLTGSLAGEPDEIDVSGVRSFRVIGSVAA